MQQIATSPNCCLSFAGFTPRQVKGLDSCMFTVECSLSRREDDENIRKQWDVSDKLVDEDLNNISPQGSFLQRGFFIKTLLAYCNSLTPRIWIVEQQQQSSALSPSPRAWGGGGGRGGALRTRTFQDHVYHHGTGAASLLLGTLLWSLPRTAASPN